MKSMLMAVMLVAVLAVPALADEVVLRDGRVLRGDIVSYDRDAVVLNEDETGHRNGIEYRVAAYAVERIVLQEAYAPSLPTVAPNQVWSAGWAAADPYAYTGLAGVGELRRQLEVTGAVVNLRNGPGLNFAVIDRVARGDRLTAIAATNGWYRLLRGDGSTAWISATLVTPLNVEEGVLQGVSGYGMTVTAPVVMTPAYGTAVCPVAGGCPAGGIDYWRQQYIEGLVRGNGVLPAAN